MLLQERQEELNGEGAAVDVSSELLNGWVRIAKQPDTSRIQNDTVFVQIDRESRGNVFKLVESKWITCKRD